MYSRFAVADDLIIDDIHDRLRRGIYEPGHAAKLLIPKRSGILRPYTVLTVEDQVVYQALINVVAEHLAPRIRNRFFTQTFGHIYAGTTSAFFYRRWQDGYKAFNDLARDAVNRGLIYSASFDLTACYDSLDHGVLCYFLSKIGCEAEFCEFLRRCLTTWTATDRRIYQNHGIPQGPLGSGLLAEAVLQHFDQHNRPKTGLVYLRYVDDIRLFARNEPDLRRVLVKLDQLSKDVGLFPQASKIDIHKVTDIDQELKSVSNPSETAVKGRIVNQKRLAKRIVQLTPRLSPAVRILDETRFKYLLAHAAPSAVLNTRMLKIAAGRPDLVPNIARYFRRYRTLPKTVAQKILGIIRAPEVYQYVTTEWIDAATGRLRPAEEGTLNRTLKAQWRPLIMATELKAAAGKQLIRAGQLTLKQTQYAIVRVRDWWVRSELVSALNDEHYGTLVLDSLLNGALRDPNPDVSLSAAKKTAELSTRVNRPLQGIQPSGGKALRQFGILKRVRGRACGIEFSLARLTGRATVVKWRNVFGAQYRQGEKIAVLMRALADTNITAFVNAADVFNDLLLSRLYAKDPTLGLYTLGQIGAVLNSQRLRGRYPAIFQLCHGIHERRLRSNLSHAVVRTTGRPTSRIPYQYLRIAKQLYIRAYNEIASTW